MYKLTVTTESRAVYEALHSLVTLMPGVTVTLDFTGGPVPSHRDWTKALDRLKVLLHPTPEVCADFAEAIEAKYPIALIKAIRVHYGYGLKESKDLVDKVTDYKG